MSRNLQWKPISMNPMPRNLQWRPWEESSTWRRAPWRCRTCLKCTFCQRRMRKRHAVLRSLATLRPVKLPIHEDGKQHLQHQRKTTYIFTCIYTYLHIYIYIFIYLYQNDHWFIEEQACSFASSMRWSARACRSNHQLMKWPIIMRACLHFCEGTKYHYTWMILALHTVQHARRFRADTTLNSGCHALSI